MKIVVYITQDLINCYKSFRTKKLLGSHFFDPHVRQGFSLKVETVEKQELRSNNNLKKAISSRVPLFYDIILLCTKMKFKLPTCFWSFMSHIVNFTKVWFTTRKKDRNEQPTLQLATDEDRDLEKKFTSSGCNYGAPKKYQRPTYSCDTMGKYSFGLKFLQLPQPSCYENWA